MSIAKRVSAMPKEQQNKFKTFFEPTLNNTNQMAKNNDGTVSKGLVAKVQALGIKVKNNEEATVRAALVKHLKSDLDDADSPEYTIEDLIEFAEALNTDDDTDTTTAPAKKKGKVVEEEEEDEDEEEESDDEEDEDEEEEEPAPKKKSAKKPEPAKPDKKGKKVVEEDEDEEDENEFEDEADDVIDTDAEDKKKAAEAKAKAKPAKKEKKASSSGGRKRVDLREDDSPIKPLVKHFAKRKGVEIVPLSVGSSVKFNGQNLIAFNELKLVDGELCGNLYFRLKDEKVAKKIGLKDFEIFRNGAIMYKEVKVSEVIELLTEQVVDYLLGDVTKTTDKMLKNKEKLEAEAAGNKANVKTKAKAKPADDEDEEEEEEQPVKAKKSAPKVDPKASKKASKVAVIEDDEDEEEEDEEVKPAKKKSKK